jgi:hypothetical protein
LACGGAQTTKPASETLVFNYEVIAEKMEFVAGGVKTSGEDLLQSTHSLIRILLRCRTRHLLAS